MQQRSTIEVNLHVDPVVPWHGMEVEEHRTDGGIFVLGQEAVRLFVPECLQQGRDVPGRELRETFAGQPVLNANVLDAYLAYQEFIPKEWRGKAVYFWGTIYRRNGEPHVRGMYYWQGKGHHQWEPHVVRFESCLWDKGHRTPAACRDTFNADEIVC